MVIEDFMKREHLKRGYDIVIGPTILKQELWERSGHFDNYRENMYFTEVEGQRYGIKPMNCLAHMLIYKSRLRSYRDLPCGISNSAQCTVTKSRACFTGCSESGPSLKTTPISSAPRNSSSMRSLGLWISSPLPWGYSDFPIRWNCQRDRRNRSVPMRIGSGHGGLKFALERQGQEYVVNEGDGAFYGPKIDFKLRDAIGRQWQCATIQCDFTLPERFDLTYVDSNGDKKRPVMLHRVILGSMDRFLGVLIEHYAGAFPVGFAPVQALILTITDEHIPFGQNVLSELRSAGIRVRADFRNEKLGLKVREAQVEKVPYMLIIGQAEVEGQTVTPRVLSGKNLDPMKIDEFIEYIKKESSVFWRG